MNDRTDGDFNLDELLHPASAFGHPSEVVSDPDLTLNEKHAILASWASDACAIGAAPELRSSPRGTRVPFDEIMEALRTIDKQANKSTGACSTNAAPSVAAATIGAVPVRRCSRHKSSHESHSVGATWMRRSLAAEPRSAYLLRGASRTEWEHSIPPLETLRFSNPFRTLRETPRRLAEKQC